MGSYAKSRIRLHYPWAPACAGATGRAPGRRNGRMGPGLRRGDEASLVTRHSSLITLPLNSSNPGLPTLPRALPSMSVEGRVNVPFFSSSATMR